MNQIVRRVPALRGSRTSPPPPTVVSAPYSFPTQRAMPEVGDQQGGWIWDGTQWVCPPDCCTPPPCDGSPWCPPPSWPPPGCPPWWSGANSPPWYPGANAGVSFSTVAPQNVVRGHFWWDGNVLWLFDGAVWVDVGVAGISGGAGATGGATVGPNPPASPTVGMLWFDGNVLHVWDGAEWAVANNPATGATPPSSPGDGSLWWNGSQLMIWDGAAWIPVSPTRSYFQTTAPVSPQQGDTWWNGTQYRIWDGTTWQLVGPGATIGPIPTTTQVFAIVQSSNVAIGAGWTAVPLNATPSIDTESAWNPASLRYQPNKAGVYQFLCRALIPAGATTGGIAVVKNDPGTFTAANPSETSVALQTEQAGSGWLTASGMTTMNGTSDYVRLWANCSDNTYHGTGANPSMAAWLMP